MLLTNDPFTPKPYAIHVNILWFLSLCTSLSCALAATLVQQWTRRYLRLSQSERAAQRRVRIRTYLHEGVHSFHLRWIVENISFLMHAAIFLFFAGLVEFLYFINNEVARVVLVAVSIFAATYIVLTGLPVLFQQCPFQTPLSSVLWYLGHFLVVVGLSLFSWSNHVRVRIEESWKHVCNGVTNHLLDKVDQKNEIDLKAIRFALRSCRDESDLEAFLDAIPGYLRSDNSGTHISDISELLQEEEEDVQLGQRIVQLYASCVSADGRMDKVARRRRAITCSRAIWEISHGFMSNKFMSKRVKVDLPEPANKVLRQLAQDCDSAVAVAALSTIAILERTLLEHLQDSQNNPNGRDPVRSREILAMLSELVHNRDPPYDVTQPDTFRYADARLAAVTEFITRIVPLIPSVSDPSHEDLDVAKQTIKELCGGLDGKKMNFSGPLRQKFVGALELTQRKHREAIGSTGKHSPQLTDSKAYPRVGDPLGQESNQSLLTTYYAEITASTRPLLQSLGASI